MPAAPERAAENRCYRKERADWLRLGADVAGSWAAAHCRISQTWSRFRR